MGNQPGRVVKLGKRTVQIEKQLAEGGFGFVYLVRDATTGEQYAVKRMIPQNDEGLRDIQHEVKIMEMLSHKNIVKFIDSATVTPAKSDPEIFILMEYCPSSLIEIMNQRGSGRFSEREIFNIFSDVCEAVAYLHSQIPPIAHRDLKVENVLFQLSSGTFKLCDFGSATTRTFQTSVRSEMIAAEDEISKYTTLQYRSPEMVDLYSGKLINEKVDVWAMGCLLYKLAFWVTPFENEGPLSISNVNYTIPANSTYSQQLHGLIRQMLTKDPDDRPDIFEILAQVSKLRGVSPPVQRPRHYKSMSTSAAPAIAASPAPPSPQPNRLSSSAPNVYVTPSSPSPHRQEPTPPAAFQPQFAPSFQPTFSSSSAATSIPYHQPMPSTTPLPTLTTSTSLRNSGGATARSRATRPRPMNSINNALGLPPVPGMQQPSTSPSISSPYPSTSPTDRPPSLHQPAPLAEVASSAASGSFAAVDEHKLMDADGGDHKKKKKKKKKHKKPLEQMTEEERREYLEKKERKRLRKLEKEREKQRLQQTAVPIGSPRATHRGPHPPAGDIGISDVGGAQSIVEASWEQGTAAGFFQMYYQQPPPTALQSDPNAALHSLVLLHRLLIRGHPRVVQEGIDALQPINAVYSAWVPMRSASPEAELICLYAAMILKKLMFHQQYRDFEGNYSLETYFAASAGIARMGDGTALSRDAVYKLVTLLTDIDAVQKLLLEGPLSTTLNTDPTKAQIVAILWQEAIGIFSVAVYILANLVRIEARPTIDTLAGYLAAHFARLQNVYFFTAGVPTIAAAAGGMLPPLPLQAIPLFDGSSVPIAPPLSNRTARTQPQPTQPQPQPQLFSANDVFAPSPVPTANPNDFSAFFPANDNFGQDAAFRSPPLSPKVSTQLQPPMASFDPFHSPSATPPLPEEQDPFSQPKPPTSSLSASMDSLQYSVRSRTKGHRRSFSEAVPGPPIDAITNALHTASLDDVAASPPATMPLSHSDPAPLKPPLLEHLAHRRAASLNMSAPSPVMRTLSSGSIPLTVPRSASSGTAPVAHSATTAAPSIQLTQPPPPTRSHRRTPSVL